jgi:Tfp pilus assembly protein PilF
MRRNILSILLLVLGGMFLLAGCGPKQRLAEGQMDTPESHYNQGMRKLDTGDLAEAQSQFQDALNLDAKYAPAWAGLSLASATRGAAITDTDSKERQREFKEAQKNLDKAEDLGKKNGEVWVAHIRMYSLWKNGDDWVENCRKGFDKVVKLDAKNDGAYYWMGLAYKQSYDFRKSEDMLRGAIDIDRSWSEKAGLALEQVHKIVEAEPGTKYGRQIALVDHITRADLAVLFIEELNVVQQIQRRNEVGGSPDLSFKAENPSSYPLIPGNPGDVEITDISSHWAESMIRDFVKTGLFDVMQDHKFYPDSAVTRIEFAGAVQRLIVMVTNDQTLFTKYAGEQQSHIKDLRTDHPYYGAAMLCVERNVMQLDKVNGYFYPQGTITGAEAVLFIRDLKNALKW